MAHDDKHVSDVAVTVEGDWFAAERPPRPCAKAEDSEDMDLGGASLLGGERRQAQRGRESLSSTSEEGLISAIAVYCHVISGTGLRFRKQQGLERWCRLINKASLIVGMAVSERKVGGLSVWLICPLGPPAPSRAVVPPDTLPSWLQD